MTIEEKMEHFRRLSLESANNQSAETLSSYKQSLEEDLEVHKETSTQLAEETKRARLNQVRANAKKELASAQRLIRKDLTKTRLDLQAKVFVLVREKLADYRKTSEYRQYLAAQIKDVLKEYGAFDITIFLDPDDAALLEDLKTSTGGNIQIYEKEFLGGTRTIVPEKNILVDYSFKTRLADEQENFSII